MRVTLIKRIPEFPAMVFVTALCSLQLLEHTAVLFVVCTFIYTTLAVVAFNIAGGLETLPGVFIFGNAVLSCILGIVTKALLGEPGQSNLRNGIGTMQVYILGMAGILAAALVERHFRARRQLISRFFPIIDLRSAYIGSAACGIAADVYFTFNGIGQPGSFSALIAHVNVFTNFAIVLGTVYTIQRTNGRTNLSPLLILLILMSTLGGVIAFSKAGMFFAATGWIVATVVTGYRLKVSDFVVLVVLLFVAVRFGVPLSQWGRNSRADSTRLIDSAPAAFYLLQNFHLVDEGYAESKDAPDDSWHYFSADLGQMERLTMMPPDDTLIDFTNRGHIFGYEPVIEEFENLIPHFIWKDKPVPFFGNVYAREIFGGSDTTTGIAFSATADCYHEGGIAGILLLEPALFSGLFLFYSYILGPTRRHPANILTALLIAFLSPGSGTDGIISEPVQLGGIVFIAALCRFVFPLIGSVFGESRSALTNRGGMDRKSIQSA